MDQWRCSCVITVIAVLVMRRSDVSTSVGFIEQDKEKRLERAGELEGRRGVS